MKATDVYDDKMFLITVNYKLHTHLQFLMNEIYNSNHVIHCVCVSYQSNDIIFQILNSNAIMPHTFSVIF